MMFIIQYSAWYKYDWDIYFQVIGVPDARLGEEVCAWIRLKPDQSVAEESLVSFCRDKVHL